MAAPQARVVVASIEPEWRRRGGGGKGRGEGKGEKVLGGSSGEKSGSGRRDFQLVRGCPDRVRV